MARKKAAKKKPVKKRAAARKKAAPRKPPAAKKKSSKVRKKPAAKRSAAAAAKKKSTKKAKSLGRPRVTADARLDQVFQKDYQSREVFEFLGVHTLRELEAFGPVEIIDKLTGPMVQTVQRIRKTLALMNRSLAGDRDFALEFKDGL